MTGGVVRRDGLRELVARWLWEWVTRDEVRENTWDDLEQEYRDHFRFAADDLSRLLDVAPTEARRPHRPGEGYLGPNVKMPARIRVDMGPAAGMDAVPDVPPTEAVTRSELDAAIGRADPHADLASLSAAIWPLFARPADVPPDPPAVTREPVVDALYPLFVEIVEDPDGRDAETEAERAADALLSSGRLVADADVRARALEDAAGVTSGSGCGSGPCPSARGAS